MKVQINVVERLTNPPVNEQEPVCPWRSSSLLAAIATANILFDVLLESWPVMSLCFLYRLVGTQMSRCGRVME